MLMVWILLTLLTFTTSKAVTTPTKCAPTSAYTCKERNS